MTAITLDNIGVITGKITGIGNRNSAFMIIFSPYEYLTHFTSENIEKDTVHEISILLTSGRFHQDNFKILANSYIITSPSKMQN